MALYAYTSTPSGLLKKIKDGIDDGSIVTWEYDGDGDFTHVTNGSQWKNKAWLRPYREDGRLQMAILKRKDEELSNEVYAVYHGRFAEMLLAHFNKDFSKIELTAGKSGNDNF